MGLKVLSQPMFHRRHMPIYLLAVWLALDVFLVAAFFWIWPGPAVQMPLLLAGRLLLWGQFVVATGWLAIGDRCLKSTFAIVILGLILLELPALPHRPNIVIAVTAMFYGVAVAAVYGLLLNVPLLILRLRGWRLRFDPEARAGGMPFYQFSIREIMVCMVMVGLLAGLWTATRPAVEEFVSFTAADHSRHVFRAALGIAILAFPLPWSIWAAFWWSRPFHGGLLAMLASGFWCVVLVRLLNSPSFEAQIAMLPAGLMIVHLLALQAAGFRWRRRVPEMPTPVDGGPDWENGELWQRLARPGTKT